MRKYPEEIKQFIYENTAGRTTKELAAMVNEQFPDFGITESQLHAYKGNHKLKSGTLCGIPKGMPTSLFPQYVKDYIMQNYQGTGPKAMTEQLNAQFGTSYTHGQIKRYYCTNKLNSGLTGHFEKGHVSHNKGQKGVYAPGSEKGWFKKGNIPTNFLEVGTLVLNSDGYPVRKVADPNEWEFESHLVWEAHNGKIPKGNLIIYLDGDKTNVDINNLAMVTRAEHLQLTRSKMRSKNAELTRAGVAVSKLTVATRKAKKK